MKHQALFSSKDKSIKKKKVSSAAILFGSIRVKVIYFQHVQCFFYLSYI